MYASVDRIEGDTIVLLWDDGREEHRSFESFLYPVTEGLVLKEEDSWLIPAFQETRRRKKCAQQMLARACRHEKEE